MQNRKSRSIAEPNRCIFISDSDAPIRIPRAYAVAVALGFHADGRQAKSDECVKDRAAARIAAFLEGERLQGVRINCKYAGDLFCERPRGRRSEDGTFSLSWAALWCPQGSKKVVEQISEIQKVVKWRMHSKPRPRSLHIYNGS